MKYIFYNGSRTSSIFQMNFQGIVPVNIRRNSSIDTIIFHGVYDRSQEYVYPIQSVSSSFLIDLTKVKILKNNSNFKNIQIKEILKDDFFLNIYSEIDNFRPELTVIRRIIPFTWGNYYSIQEYGGNFSSKCDIIIDEKKNYTVNCNYEKLKYFKYLVDNYGESKISYNYVGFGDNLLSFIKKL